MKFTNVAEKTDIVLADSGYSSYEKYRWLTELGKTAYIPDKEERASKERLADPFDGGPFVYDPVTKMVVLSRINSLLATAAFKVLSEILCL